MSESNRGIGGNMLAWWNEFGSRSLILLGTLSTDYLLGCKLT